MKRYEFTRTNFYSDNPNSEKVELGSLEDVNEFLEQLAD